LPQVSRLPHLQFEASRVLKREKKAMGERWWPWFPKSVHLGWAIRTPKSNYKKLTRFGGTLTLWNVHRLGASTTPFICANNTPKRPKRNWNVQKLKEYVDSIQNNYVFIGCNRETNVL
jgi:hypothetical protein